MKKGQKIWAKKLFDDYKDRLTEGRGYTIISSNSDGIKIIDDNGEEIYNGLIWFECFFSLTPPYEPVLIAEQPKAELSGTLATCSKPDPRLFTAAVAAMQGMLANPNYMTEYKGEKYLLECNVVSKVAFDYAKSLINEGKKRNLL